MQQTLLILFFILGVFSLEVPYFIGKGKADITGPLAPKMMGYAQTDQQARGILTRQYARTFIIEDTTTKKRVVLVTLDYHSGYSSVKLNVLKKLKQRFGDLYNEENVEISGTHAHSGVGGISYHLLYNFNNFGFEKKNLDIQVQGIYESIVEAHASLQLGFIYYGETILGDASLNRSPIPYTRNPESERNKYPEGNRDIKMKVLKFLQHDKKPFGSISWFSVHPVSVSSSNQWLNGDNKGYAASLMEAHFGNNFIAAFPNGAAGDITPNIRGPHCPDGRPCDRNETCNGNFHVCLNVGPTKDQYLNMKIIGEKQFRKSLEAFLNGNTLIQGPVKNILVNEDISNYQMRNGKRTCKAALGTNFVKGTTDGKGIDIRGIQANAILASVVSAMTQTTQEQRDCHLPKQLFGNVELNILKNDLSPKIIPFQLFQIGNVFIPLTPGEHTTMSGRRIVETIRTTLSEQNCEKNPIILLTSYANEYNQYTVTPEEYEEQRYEAASSLYGQFTLNAHQEIYEKLTKAMCTNAKLESKPVPVVTEGDLLKIGNTLIHADYDVPPLVGRIGDVKKGPAESYKKKTKVSVQFWSGSLYFGFENLKTLLTVEREEDSKWVVAYTDAEVDTVIEFQRQFLAKYVDVDFDTTNARLGKYRICHQGHIRTFGFDKLEFYQRCTNPFLIVE